MVKYSFEFKKRIILNLAVVTITKVAGRRENHEAFQIWKYVEMEFYKKVMVSVISSSKVIGGRLYGSYMEKSGCV